MLRARPHMSNVAQDGACATNYSVVVPSRQCRRTELSERLAHGPLEHLIQRSSKWLAVLVFAAELGTPVQPAAATL